MLQLVLFDLVFNNSYKYNGKHWKREPLEKKDNLKLVLLKGVISATLSISIPFKAFSLLSKYLNLYIKVYIIKWARPVLFIQGLKKKHISGLRAGKKNTKLHFSHKSNLKYKSYLAYIITPHCNSRFGTISFHFLT